MCGFGQGEITCSFWDTDGVQTSSANLSGK